LTFPICPSFAGGADRPQERLRDTRALKANRKPWLNRLLQQVSALRRALAVNTTNPGKEKNR
jgi:hypothetical protein